MEATPHHRQAMVTCLHFIPRISGKRGRVLCKGKICSNFFFLFLKGNSGKFVKCEPKGTKWRVRQRRDELDHSTVREKKAVAEARHL